MRAGEDAFYVYVRDATTDALGDPFGPITQGGLVVIPPLQYHENGTVTLSLFSPDAEIQLAIETTPSPVDVTIEQISGLEATAVAVETHLSERQREAGHEDIATVLNCAPSTAAEHLQKAESKLVSLTSVRR